MERKIFIPLLLLFLFLFSPLAFSVEKDKEAVSLDSEDTTSQEEIKQIEALETLGITSEELETLSRKKSESKKQTKALETLGITAEELETLTHKNSEGRDEPGDFDDDGYHFVVGGGYVSHSFDQTDEFRKSTGAVSTDGETDEIKSMGGLEIFGEYLVGSMDQFGNLSFGLNYQILSRVFKYAEVGGTIDRTVEMVNTVAYTSWSAGLGGKKYWRLGGLLGFGSSTYTYSLDWERTDSNLSNLPSNKSSNSANGTVTKFEFFADWGQDMSGGRMGYSLISTAYDLIENSMPDGSGGQLFINFRLGF